MQDQVSTSWVVGNPSKTVPIFTYSAKRMESGVILMEDETLPIGQYGRFSSIAAFNHSIWKEYLYKFDIWSWEQKGS